MTTLRLTDAAELMDDLGVRVSRTTRKEVIGWCPMHKERTGREDGSPSWSINRETGMHQCFSCGYKGGIVKLAMDVLGLDLWDALSWTRENGVSLTDAVERFGARVSDVPMVPRHVDDGTKDVAREYATLALPPDAALEGRGLSKESALAYGLRWKNDGWVIPIRLPSGKLIGWQEKSEHRFRNYPVGVRKGQTLFGIELLNDQEAVLVESPLDVVRLHTLGYECGLASFGATVSAEQMELLILRCNAVVLGLDNDIAGVTSAETVWKKYRERIRIKFLNYLTTDAKDVGDMTEDEVDYAIGQASHFYRPSKHL